MNWILFCQMSLLSFIEDDRQVFIHTPAVEVYVGMI